GVSNAACCVFVGDRERREVLEAERLAKARADDAAKAKVTAEEERGAAARALERRRKREEQDRYKRWGRTWKNCRVAIQQGLRPQLSSVLSDLMRPKDALWSAVGPRRCALGTEQGRLRCGCLQVLR
ncbi:unnamed protein product, partial [Discosporangium mesarthrocarpum]